MQGVEEASDPDVYEVTMRQVPDNDFPAEYLNEALIIVSATYLWL